MTKLTSFTRYNIVQAFGNAMAQWLASRPPNHKIVGSSPAKASWLIINCPAWATGDNNGVSVHLVVNEYSSPRLIRLPSLLRNCGHIREVPFDMFDEGTNKLYS